MFSRMPRRTHASWLIVLALVTVSFAGGAAVGVTWNRDEIIPVVLVKPGIGGFEPSEGSSIDNTWTKSQVKPVLLVKPGIGGFEPREEISIGNTWRKSDVLPVMLVESGANGFIPLRLITSTASSRPAAGPGAGTTASQTDSKLEAARTIGAEASDRLEDAERKLAEMVAKLAPAGDGPPLIETRISGTFEGWQGETIFKMENGQIWQQVTYAYTYHYAFRPKVYLIKTHGVYKMKVEGVSGTIFVKQLR